MALSKKILSPLHTSLLSFSNRIVMAPMNRRRAMNGVPSDAMVNYYGQRASAGLIITDNTAIAANAIGYLNTPGIYNSQQRESWKKVIEAVHKRNGKIFVQLVHTGRIGHPLNHKDRMPLVAPSDYAANETILTSEGTYLPMPKPKVLSFEDTQELVQLFIHSAKNAMELGFDGVEIHAAHGFLIDQFLNPKSNNRTDSYGGNITNRSRFLMEIMEGVQASIGKERTGVRLSPFAEINGLSTYNEEFEAHQYITDELSKMDILYIHLSNIGSKENYSISTNYIQEVRKRFKNLLIVTGGYSPKSAEITLRNNLADLIGFGKPYISNPDLVERIRHNAPLAIPNKDTFYHGGENGYIDYPVLYDNDKLP
ncbi:alkene reductase [Flagellimonas olearia]|uniref:Alkene reductase n=1 Tax=Flagellimonas olearia TaxID=552546 RepID=A0A6I1DXL7_9FLAO|nr:alkene reductase [Allomuricauda olearia]KAB7530233.1 alkene reductase [Allomuricauda olearia]